MTLEDYKDMLLDQIIAVNKLIKKRGNVEIVDENGTPPERRIAYVRETKRCLVY